MPDLWILAFLVRGVIAVAGDTVPLEQCLQRGRDMPPANTQVVCIHVQDPTCRVYLKNVPLTADISKRCTSRVAKQGTT